MAHHTNCGRHCLWWFVDSHQIFQPHKRSRLDCLDTAGDRVQPSEGSKLPEETCTGLRREADGAGIATTREHLQHWQWPDPTRGKWRTKAVASHLAEYKQSPH